MFKFFMYSRKGYVDLHQGGIYLPPYIYMMEPTAVVEGWGGAGRIYERNLLIVHLYDSLTMNMFKHRLNYFTD